MEIFKLVLPLIFNFIVILIMLMPSYWKRKVILISLFFQILINLVALVLAIVNLSSEAINSLNLGLSIVAIILSVILFFTIIWRRWEFTKSIIYG